MKNTLARYSAAFYALALIGAILLVSGCASYQAVVAERSATASDDATQATLWTLCNALPVGAIRREFDTEAEQTAYISICPAP